mgnify:CR=1 FL=1
MISTIIYTTRKVLIFLFAFALAHVILELGAHGLRLVEDGADVGLDGHIFLPAVLWTEWNGIDQLCGAVGVCCSNALISAI